MFDLKTRGATAAASHYPVSTANSKEATIKHLFTILFVLTSVATASAEVIDFSAETCQQFRGTSKDRLEVILSWLDGYYKRENDAPSMNLQVVSSNEKKLMDYCAEHPEVSLFTATAKLFDK